MKLKLIDNKSDELIIFLTGWGCDDVQFKNMKSTKDVLLCWDYSDLNFEFNFSKYKKFYLIAYSAGVFVAGLIQDKLPNISKSIAINGSPLMFDEYFGIPSKTIDVMKNLNLDNYMDFRKIYLVFNNEELIDFNNNASQRSFESCDIELEKLEEYSKAKYSKYNYDLVLLSDNDKIFQFEHQKEYFKDKYIILKNHAHNVFSMFKNYDEILNYSS